MEYCGIYNFLINFLKLKNSSFYFIHSKKVKKKPCYSVFKIDVVKYKKNRLYQTQLHYSAQKSSYSMKSYLMIKIKYFYSYL